jgi:hypothetical protein
MIELPLSRGKMMRQMIWMAIIDEMSSVLDHS